MIETRPHGTSDRARYSEVLEQCRDIVLIFSNSQLSELFENAGSALLDFAERAENNAIQGRFFEAMGLVQRRRPDIEHIFRQEIADGFDNFGHMAPPSQEHESGAADGEDPDGLDSKLSLVEPDEMEESVAAENLTIKANATYFQELYALSHRLAVINDGKKLKEYEIPAGPHHLVRAYRRSLANLDLEVRIKIILYALFDKFVMKQAKGLYDELNSSLKAAGILPNLKPVPLRGDQGGAQAAAKPGASEEEAKSHPESQEAPSLGAELFDSIIDLMSNRRFGGRRSAARRPRAPVDPAVAAAESRHLVSALGNLQSQTSGESVSALVAEAVEIPNIEVDTAFIEKVKSTLTQEREHVLSQIDRDKLSPMDADLIDLIGMLFEYMLNDPVLPNVAKALLSHLHTPYLKVALIDRRLLVDVNHPARRLLDQMVESGSLWVEENNPQRGIFPAMRRIVDRVLQEFTNDVSLFEELLTSFEQSMSEQQRRTDTTEQRTQDAARGREKLQLAKRRANHQIQLLLQNGPLPPQVVAFLSKTWMDHLVFILLRDEHEDRGDAWKQAVTTAENLFSLFDPDVDPAERKPRYASIPTLREEITAAIQHTGSYTHATLDALYSLLEAPDTWDEKAAERAAESAPPAQQLEPPPALAEGPSAADEQISEKEQAVIKRLRKMKFGTWFEFSGESGGPSRRIKLSWLSPLTATCMFVDRSGMQAEIKTLHELAQEILSGRAKVIPRPKHPFIERAMVSIRKMLQSEDKKPAAVPGQR